MLVWRRADNVTLFTNGTDTWLLGPCGLQQRPNGAVFAWERGFNCRPVVSPDALRGYTEFAPFGPCVYAVGANASPEPDPAVQQTRFSQADAVVHVYVTLYQCPIVKPVHLDFTFIDPNGDVAEIGSALLVPRRAEQVIFAALMPIADSDPPRPTGVWSLAINANGTLMGVYVFDLEEAETDTPPATDSE
jgi:hypothetical protein